MNSTSIINYDALLENDSSSLGHEFLVAVMTITAIVILVGNGLAIWAVYKNPVLQTPKNYILASLAVTDLFSGLISIPLELYNRHEKTTCSFLLTSALSLLSYMFGLISALHYIAATTDRYVAVTRPLRYAVLITTQRVANFVGLSWVASVIIIGIAFGIFSSVSSDTPSIRCNGVHYTDPVQQGILYFVAVAITLFCITLLILNLKILQIAIHQSRRIADVQMLFGPRDGTPGKVKAVKTTLVIVGVFCICWLPTILSHILVVTADLPKTVYIVILDGSFVMISFSSAITPYVYCFRDRPFRRAFLEGAEPLIKIFQRKSE